jgi:hypothetical protein
MASESLSEIHCGDQRLKSPGYGAIRADPVQLWVGINVFCPTPAILKHKSQVENQNLQGQNAPSLFPTNLGACSRIGNTLVT